IKDLLRDKVFYIFPTNNPDGREHFVTQAATPRSGLAPRDDDRDGLFDEDGFDDMNGDGERSQMRKKNPDGQYRVDPNDPRKMIRVGPGEKGEYDLIGTEGGIDNDNDGRTDEDGPGSYDANRDWGYNWRPNFIQSGADKYPFSFPENQAVRDFGFKHMNIAGTQSYHNSGGMVLKGPSVEGGGSEVYSREDEMVITAIGKVGEKLIQGYRLVTIWSDMYTVWGGELDWWYASIGAFTYSNELWTGNLMFNSVTPAATATPTPQSQGGGMRGGQAQQETPQFSWDQYDFDKLLLAGDAFIPWTEVDHPVHGKVEIGGFTKAIGRLHPGFLLETDAHRNTAFLLYHAYNTPKLEVTDIKVNDIGGGLKEVIATIENTRMMPTHSAQNIRYRIDPPNYIYLDGGNVVAGMVVTGQNNDVFTEQIKNPSRMEIPNIRGNSKLTIKWIVSSGSKFTVRVESVKGGRATSSTK
ncbi:MAG: peptidase M14, partial [Bacteroidales bacterium]|nr:peptidase M14 [Bacteroidales bacterium]